MAKLYPPVIEGTIPAFNGTDLTVPFSMNRSVSINQIGGFSLKVKTIQSNKWSATVNTGKPNLDYSAAEFRNITSVWTPTPGQFYKIQLAYLDFETGEPGYYSTVGVVKYTNINKRNIQLQYQNTTMSSVSNIYPFTHEYAAAYDYSQDPMEKIYQYRFTIYPVTDDTVLYTSGWCLHDATQDSALYTSIDKYTFVNDLPENQVFRIGYEAVTVNGLYLKTSLYKVTMTKEMVSQYQMTLTAENNYDNGYVHLKLKGKTITHNGELEEEKATGQFKIYRRDLRDNKRWEPIITFHLTNQPPSAFTDLKDFTVEHGVQYEYKICQFNNIGIMAICAYSNRVYVDFEDMFLFDGEHQLKVRFNPKVSSFKNDILESKMDTIGSQYPFFFRNGVVHYKEFPISGLISYWSDNEELFMTLDELGLDDLEKVVRNYTAPNPSLDLEGNRYHYDYEDVSTNMLWVRQRIFTPVTRWLGDKTYYIYDATTKTHIPYEIPEPEARHEIDEETGEDRALDLTYYDWNKSFQTQRRNLQEAAWAERLAAIGESLPESQEERDAYLANDTTAVLFVIQKLDDWHLVPADRLLELETTQLHDWLSLTKQGLPNGAIVYDAAVAGYNSVVNTQPKTTDLVNYNIAAERQFKLNVLEWLTNGEPKLFRSPAEGNYIIRLLNTSLTPTDSLGRMLHSFSSTAYEIDDLTYETLTKYGFIKSGLLHELSQYQPEPRSIPLYDVKFNVAPWNKNQFTQGEDEDGEYVELLVHPITHTSIFASGITIEGAQPGDEFIKIDEQWIMINQEGYYNVDGVTVRSIKFYPNNMSTSTMPVLHYEYLSGFTGMSELDAIYNLAYVDVPMRQFVQNLPFAASVVSATEPNINILSKIEDEKTRLAHIYQLSFEQRPTMPLYSDYDWDTKFANATSNTMFNKEAIVHHFSFTGDVNDWAAEISNDGESSTTLEMMRRMPMYIYEIQSAAQGTRMITRGTMATDTTVYEKVLATDNLNEINNYCILNNEDPLEFIPIDYIDISDIWNTAEADELIDILYIEKLVNLTEYELPTGEGRHCYIDGTRYESNEELQNADELIPQPVNVYTNEYRVLNENAAPVYAVFDSDNQRLRIIDNLDTKVYINTGDRIELSQAVREEYDITHKTVDVSMADVVYYDLDTLTDIYIGNGVLMSMSYQILITTYTVETHTTLLAKRAFYLWCAQQLADARKLFTVEDLVGGEVDPDAAEVRIEAGEEPGENPFDSITLPMTRAEWAEYSYQKYLESLTEYMAQWKEA